MKRLSFTGLLMFALAWPALAQEVYPLVQFGVGHSFLHDNDSGVNHNGIIASATGNFNRWFGVESEFGGNFDLDGWSYVGGPRFTLRRERTSSYFHLLLGGVRQSGPVSAGTALSLEGAVQTGGGVILWTTRRVGVNFGGDYRKIYPEFGLNRSEVRFTMGVIFGAGTRF